MNLIKLLNDGKHLFSSFLFFYLLNSFLIELANMQKSPFAFMSFIYSMKHLKSSIASLYAYINPIVAIWVGSLLLDEQMTWNNIVGSIITLIGVYLVNKSLKDQKDPVNAISDADGM